MLHNLLQILRILTMHFPHDIIITGHVHRLLIVHNLNDCGKYRNHVQQIKLLLFAHYHAPPIKAPGAD